MDQTADTGIQQQPAATSVPPVVPPSQPPRDSVLPLVIAAAVVVLLAVGAGAAYLFIGNRQTAPPDVQPDMQPTQTPGPKGCTMEAKLCPDGTSVGRSGPDCQFTPCPTAKVTPSPNPSPVPVSTSSGAWQTYTDTRDGFSIQYPGGVILEEPNFEMSTPTVSFTYVGPTQKASGRTQTELFDGYKVVVQVSTIIENPDPKAAAAQARDRTLLANEGTSCTATQVVQGTLDGRKTGEYTATDCYGDSRTVIAIVHDRVYWLTALYTDSTYKNTANRIISTLKFLTPVTPTP